VKRGVIAWVEVGFLDVRESGGATFFPEEIDAFFAFEPVVGEEGGREGGREGREGGRTVSISHN
jgi:hypothetical protein